MSEAVIGFMIALAVICVHLERCNFWIPGGPREFWARSDRPASAAKLLILFAIVAAIASGLITQFSLGLFILGITLMVGHLGVLAFLTPPPGGWPAWWPKWLK